MLSAAAKEVPRAKSLYYTIHCFLQEPPLLYLHDHSPLEPLERTVLTLAGAETYIIMGALKL